MVATGARVRCLTALLLDAGWAQVAPPRLPGVNDLLPRQRDRIRLLYDILDGDPDQFDRARPGGWDLAFQTPDGLLLVELDEEQHFNRYRASTLDGCLPWTRDYRAYCRDHEHLLLPGWGTGKRWTNPSAARFFGEPSAPGNFSGVGAPRWRQRAFYDAVKDALPNRRLARISVHDPLGPKLPSGTVETLLRRPDPSGVPALAAWILKRAHEA